MNLFSTIYVVLFVTATFGKEKCSPDDEDNNLTGRNAESVKVLVYKVETKIRLRYSETSVTTILQNTHVSKTASYPWKVIIPKLAFLSAFHFFYVSLEFNAIQGTVSIKNRNQSRSVSMWVRNANIFSVDLQIRPLSEVQAFISYGEVLERNFGYYQQNVYILPDIVQTAKSLIITTEIKESDEIKFVRIPFNIQDAAIVSKTVNHTKVIWNPDVYKNVNPKCSVTQYTVQYDVQRNRGGDINGNGNNGNGNSGNGNNNNGDGDDDGLNGGGNGGKQKGTNNGNSGGTLGNNGNSGGTLGNNGNSGGTLGNNGSGGTLGNNGSGGTLGNNGSGGTLGNNGGSGGTLGSNGGTGGTLGNKGTGNNGSGGKLGNNGTGGIKGSSNGENGSDGTGGGSLNGNDRNRDRNGSKYAGDSVNSGDVVLVSNYFFHFLVPVDLKSLRKHLIFVQDVSGSMNGRKLEQMKEAMMKTLSDLKPDDYFNILTFNGNTKHWKTDSSTIAADSKNITRAKEFVKKLEAGGRTAIKGALEESFKLISDIDDNQTLPDNVKSLIVFMTDGLPTDANTSYILTNTQKLNKKYPTPIHALGFGNEADMKFLKSLALQNFGLSRQIFEGSDAADQLKSFYTEISTPVLTDVTITYNSPDFTITGLSVTNFTTVFGGKEIKVTGKIVPKSPGRGPFNLTITIKGNSRRGPITITKVVSLLLSQDVADSFVDKEKTAENSTKEGTKRKQNKPGLGGGNNGGRNSSSSNRGSSNNQNGSGGKFGNNGSGGTLGNSGSEGTLGNNGGSGGTPGSKGTGNNGAGGTAGNKGVGGTIGNKGVGGTLGNAGTGGGNSGSGGTFASSQVGTPNRRNKFPFLPNRGSANGEEEYVNKIWTQITMQQLIDSYLTTGNSSVLDEIIKMALKNGIVTPYTSMTTRFSPCSPKVLLDPQPVEAIEGTNCSFGNIIRPVESIRWLKPKVPSLKVDGIVYNISLSRQEIDFDSQPGEACSVKTKTTFGKGICQHLLDCTQSDFTNNLDLYKDSYFCAIKSKRSKSYRFAGACCLNVD